MSANPDLIEYAVLCPGERFTRIGSPHVVSTKTSHTWAVTVWRQHRYKYPIHWTTLIRRAPVGQRNPDEPFEPLTAHS